MYSIKLLLSLAVVAIISCAEASKTITVMAFGEGDSYENALQVALQDAVRQVNGSVVRSDVRRTSTSQEIVTVVGDQEQQNATSVEGSSGGTREVLKGVVKGHRIKDKKTLPNGRVEVKIEADVLKYESPVGNSGLPKIAVFPFRSSAPEYGVGGKVRSGARIARDMCRRVEKVMSQSGQFSMLSRDNEDAMVSEEQYILQKAPVEESIKVGQRMGADYIVVGEVRDCVVSPPVESVSRLTGKKRIMIAEATLRVSCRMLVVSTSQIVWADDISIDLTGEQIRTAGGRTEEVYEKLLETAAGKMLEAADVFMLQHDR